MPVAQLDRATGYGPVGRGFEPLQARQFFNDGRVAQLVEQGTENPRVTGSTPVPATIFKASQTNGLRGFFVSVNAAFGLSLIFPCLYLISNSKTDQRGTKGETMNINR